MSKIQPISDNNPKDGLGYSYLLSEGVDIESINMACASLGVNTKIVIGSILFNFHAHSEDFTDLPPDSFTPTSLHCIEHIGILGIGLCSHQHFI